MKFQLLTIFILLVLATGSALAADISWNNPAGGDWSEGSNWVGGVAPGSGDVALIDLSGTYTVTLDGDATVGGLDLGAGSGEQTLSLSGRVLTLNGSSEILDSGKLEMQNSTLAGTGSLQITGMVILQQGNTLDLDVDLDGEFHVHHQANQVNGSFSTTASALLNIQIVNNWNPQITFASGWTNLGSITMGQTINYARASLLGITSGTLVNDGSIQTSGGYGSRTFQGDVRNNGTMVLDQTTTLNSGAGGSSNHGTIDIAQDWAFNVSGGFDQAGGQINGPGHVEFNGAQILVSTNQVPGAELRLTSSTLDAPGTLLNAGVVSLYSGNTVETALQNQGTLNIYNQGNTMIGTLTTTTSSLVNLEIVNNWNPQITFASGWTNLGAITMGQSINYARATALTVTSGSLVNGGSGTIDVSGGYGSRTINADVVNEGAVALSHNLTLNSGNTGSRNEAAITIAQDKVLTVSGDFDQMSGAIDGPGVVSFSGAAVTISSGTVPGAELQFTSSTLHTPGALTNAGTLTFFSGNTVLAGTQLINQGVFNVHNQGNTVAGVFENPAGSLLNLEIVNNWNPQITFNNGFANHGTIEMGQSINYARATQLAITGTPLTNAAGGVINASGGYGSRTLDLTLLNDGTLNADQNLTLNSDTGQSVNNGTINVAAAMVLTVTGGFQHSAGNINGPGHVEFNGADVILLPDVGPAADLRFTSSTLGAGGTLGNGGQLTFYSGNTITADIHNTNSIHVYNQGNSFAGQLTTAPGSLLNLEIVNNWNPQITFAQGFINHGTISLGQSIAYGRAHYLALSSGQLVNAAGGTISVSGSNGSRTIDADLLNHGMLDVDHGLTLNSAAGGSTNDGTIDLAEARVLTVSGEFDQAGGAINGPGHVNFSGAQVTISTNLVPDAELQFTNSSLAAPGVLDNGGTLTIYSGNTISADLANSGLINVFNQTNDFLGQLTTTAASTLNIEIVNNWNPQISFAQGFTNNGLINLGQTIAYGRANLLQVSSGQLVNAAGGSITTGGSNGSRTIEADLVNHGLLDLDYTLALNPSAAGSQNGASIDIAENQVLNVTGSFEQAGGDILGPGHVSFNNAAVDISTGVAPTAELVFNNSSLTAPVTGLENGGHLIFLANNTISCGIANSGTIAIQNQNNSFDGDFVTTDTALLSMDIVNNWNPQATWATGWTNNGTIRLGQTIAYGRTTALAVSSGTLVNAVGGLVEVQGTNGSRGILADFENHGRVHMDHPFNLEGSTVLNAPGGVFEGRGGLTVPAGFQNQGVCSPGLLEAEGRLDVFSDYSQDPEGVFSVQIGGVTPNTEHDQMIVLGHAALDGTLDIELVDGFVPAYGDSFIIVDHETRSGQFDAISGLEIPGGLFFNIAYRDDYVVLAAGDFLPPTTRVITASAGLGGSIAPEGSVFVENGGEATFSITPDAGYGVGDVLVDGVSVGPAAVYHFASVTADHTIDAYFAPTGFDFETINIGSDTNMNAIYWGDTDHGIVVGAGGEIRLTGDGGLTWWQADHGVTVDLQDVVMIGGIIYAVGDNGVICYSDDGGQTWAMSPTGTTNNLNAVEFVHSGYGYAVGDDGTILCWDGVNGWIPQIVPGMPPGASLHDITIVDGVVYIVGANGLIIRRDGPDADWAIMWSGQGFDFHAVSIYGGTGYAVGSGGQVWYTGDGGLTWIYVDTGFGVIFHDCLHVGGDIYLVGDGTFIRSSDGGLSWTAIQLPGGGGYRGMTTIECRGYVTGLLGETLEYESAGCVEDPGTIQGQATLDGVGQEGITIRLEDADAMVVELVPTDAAGFYRFENLEPGFYMVHIELPSGLATPHERFLILVRPGATAVVDFLLVVPSGVDGGDLPTQLTVGAYPNPFNPMTKIHFEMPRSGEVNLEIYDSAGRLVRRLMSSESYPAGRHAVTWQGGDEAGRRAASGVYHYLLRVEGEQKLGKITLLK